MTQHVIKQPLVGFMLRCIKIDKPLLLKPFRILCGLILISCLPPSTLASPLPRICEQRAVEIGIFHPQKSKDFTQNALKNPSIQVFDFQAIHQAYQTTLEMVTNQLEDYTSPLFNFLKNCSSDPSQCHGYFHEKNGFDTRIFCDREIYRMAIETVLEKRISKFDECSDQPFDEIEVRLLNELEEDGIHYSKDCFYEVNSEPAILKNKSHKLLKEIEFVAKWHDRFLHLTKDAIERSLITGGVEFVLRKTIEEFEDLSLRDAKIKDVNTYYNTIALIDEFSNCCDGKNLYLPDSHINARSIMNAGESLHQQLMPPNVEVFKVKDYLTSLVFREAEKQYWKDLLQRQSPLSLSTKQQLKYFEFLKMNPYFFKDPSFTFEDFKIHTKNQLQIEPREEIAPRFPTYEEEEKLIEEWQGYQRQLGYKKPETFERYEIPVEDHRKIQNYFIFNPPFQNHFTKSLEDGNDQFNKSVFEEQKKIFYPKIFRSFLPYQFEKVVQAKIIREIQKHTKEYAQNHILHNFDQFHSWINQTICSEYQFTYCKSSQKDFRKRKHLQLYQKLISEDINLHFNRSENIYSKRKFVYDKVYIDKINFHIRTINNFCWNSIPEDRKVDKFDPNSISEAQTQKLWGLIQNFYEMDHFEELLGQPEFFELLGFNPFTIEKKCFESGLLFSGDRGFFESELDMNPKLDQYFFDENARLALTQDKRLLYGDKELLFINLPLKKIYLPPTFQVNLTAVNKVESEIENKIQKEFNTLQKAYNYSRFDQYKEFLEESVTSRIFALVEYAIDHPSQEVGQYICNLIYLSDLSQHQKQQTRQFIIHSSLIAASVATIFILPAVTAGITTGAALVYESGVILALTSVSLTHSYFEIQHLGKKKNDAATAVLTNNMQAGDAHQLYLTYNDQITYQQWMVGAEVALTIVIGAKPFLRSIDYLNKVRNKQWILTRTDRTMKINKYRRGISHEKDFYLEQGIVDFVTDKTKVTDDLFEGFFQAVKKGEAEDFIKLHWQKELAKYVPIKKMPVLFPKNYIQPLRNRLDDALSKNAVLKVPYMFLKNHSIFATPKYWNLKAKNAFLNLMNDYIQYYNRVRPNLEIYGLVSRGPSLLDKHIHWIQGSKHSLYKKGYINYRQYKRETNIINMIKNSQETAEITGKHFFSDKEIQQLAKNMKYHRFRNGRFTSLPNVRIEKNFNVFLHKSVQNIQANTLKHYLEPIIKGELLDAHEWEIILKHFKGKITSLEDAKAFKKALIFSKKELLTTSEKLQYRFLKNNAHAIDEESKSILGRAKDRVVRTFDPPAYAERTKEILIHLDDYYNLAKYSRTKANIRIAEFFKTKFSDAQHLDNFINHFDEYIKLNKIDDDLFIKKQIKNYKNNIDYIQSFNLDKYQGRFHKSFLEEEEMVHTYFIRKMNAFSKYATSPKEFGKAYHKAINKARLKKTIQDECRLPNSLDRKQANETYVHYAKMVTLSSNFLGYWSTHYKDEKDFEFWTRFGFDMAIPYVGSWLQAGSFVKKGRLPASKPLVDWAMGLGIMGTDITLYEGMNRTIWNQEDKYQKEFSKIVFEAENVEKQIEDFFDTHPEIKDKILQRLEVLQDAFDEMERLDSRGTLVESQMEDLFIRKGLVDMIYYEDMKRNHQEQGSNYVYHELMKDHYIDEELFSKHYDGTLEDQLDDFLAEMMYEDLYRTQSSSIKYPFLDEIQMPDLSAFEVKSNQNILFYGPESVDRYVFYAGFDLARAPLTYYKNNLVYNLLCKQRYMPGNINTWMALGVHALYKMTMDPLKYYLREQGTGR